MTTPEEAPPASDPSPAEPERVLANSDENPPPNPTAPTPDPPPVPENSFAADADAPPSLAEFAPEIGADFPDFIPTTADGLLKSVYGDYPHHNPGTHLHGDIDDDAKWQRYHQRLTAITPNQYDLPKGRVGKRFIILMTKEWDGVRDRSWNSEHPLLFSLTVLQKTPDVRSAGDIRRRLVTRMNQWEAGQFQALVDDTEATALSLRGGQRAADEASKMRAFNTRVTSGRLRSGVRALTNRGGGKGVLEPDDTCTKTGRPVLEILRSKHPKMRDPAPDLADPDRGSFEPHPSLPQPLPLEVTDEVVVKVASRLSGGAGPSGIDAVSLRNWLLRFGKESEALRISLAKFAEWMANGAPPWAALRALMACRLVALDKNPGVRPLGIGEAWRRLFAKCILLIAGGQATASAGNLNLCAGLAAGIEGAVHAVREAWEKPPGTPPHFSQTPPPGVDATPLPPPAPASPTAGRDGRRRRRPPASAPARPPGLRPHRRGQWVQ